LRHAPGVACLLAALLLASAAPAAAQAPRAELAGSGALVLPVESRLGSGWRIDLGLPAAGRLPVSLVVGGGEWTASVRHPGDPAVNVPITGPLHSAFGSAALRVERAPVGVLTALTAGVVVHSNRAALRRDPPTDDDEVRARERALSGLHAGPTLALTLARRPLLGRALLADLTLRRAFVGGIEPWELSAGVVLRPGRVGLPAPRIRAAPSPPGAAAPVRRPPDVLLASLEAVARSAGFEVVDADDGWRMVVAGDAFPSASATLPASARAALGELGALLASTTARVRVIGHTDHTGPERVNQRLSERRALAVLDALLAGGVEPDRVAALGYGSALPRAPGETPAGRAANRRVEIVVSDG
jgi:outer membrane protein OmpA-like peptidoglycan-associated protein